MDIEKLQDIISKYSYGQFNILENGMTITYNSSRRKLKLSPFYQYDAPSLNGTCGELMNWAYRDISEKYKELHVIRVRGKEPEFFFQTGDIHGFLIVSNKDIMHGLKEIDKKQHIENIISTNPIIVDPSFQKVLKFSDSGYEVQSLINKGVHIEYSKSTVLKDHEAVPLCLSSKREMIYIVGNFNSEHFLDIGIQSPFGMIRQHELDDPVLDRYLSCEKAKEFIDMFRSKNKIQTRENLKDEFTVSLG